MSDTTTIGAQSELCAQLKAAVHEANGEVQSAAANQAAVWKTYEDAQQEFDQGMSELRDMIRGLADPETPVELTRTALGVKLNAAAHEVPVVSSLGEQRQP